MPHRRLLRFMGEYPTRLLALILILLAAITVAYIWWSTEQFGQYVECQAEWGDQMVAAQIASNESALMDRRLDRREIRSVIVLIEHVQDEDISNDEAIKQWRDSIAEIDQERVQITSDRESSPLPSPPTQVCER